MVTGITEKPYFYWYLTLIYYSFKMANNITNNVSTRNLPAEYRCFLPMFPTDFQKRYFKVTHTVATPLNMTCVLLSIVLNFIILITVFRRRRLRAPSSLLLYSLNLKDISFIALGQTLQIYVSLVYLIKDNFCILTRLESFSLFVVFSSRAIGLVSMVVISIDRCFAIHKPHVYRRGLSKQRVVIVVIIVWTFSVAIGAVVPFLTIQKLSMVMMMLFGATVVAVTLLQLVVYYGVKRQRSRTGDMNSAQLRQMALERSVATVVFYIILGLAICYIPFLSSVALILFNGQNYVYFGKIWFQFCIYFNALINPIVMLKTNTNLRTAVLHTVSPCLCCSYSMWDETLPVESLSKEDKQQRTATRQETAQQVDKLEDNNNPTNPINLEFVKTSNLLEEQ